MKKLLSLMLLQLALLAASAQTPDVRIKTSIYQKDGPTNAFTLVLGAAPEHEGYADVKCSGGNQTEVELKAARYDQETGELIGTYIACQVNEEGIVEVYCDEGVVIDYLSCTGAEITSIEFKNPENMEILALEHNLLESFDLTPFSNLVALYLKDNPMNVAPLMDYGRKENLRILNIEQIGDIFPTFDIWNYPNLESFDAMSTHGLMRITPEACPNLKKISIDNTSVSYLDVTKNPELLILNISESRIRQIDLSQNTKLQQFYATHSSAFNSDVKLTSVDVSHCPDLFYLFLNDNELTQLDVSQCPALQDLYVRGNHLTSIDLSQNQNLLNVFLTHNDMDFTSLPKPQETWLDFDLSQRPLQVPSSCLLGSPIDLTSRLLRGDGSETFANVYTTSEDEPGLIHELDPSLYTFAAGVLTVNTVTTDSIYASFYNNAFPDTELITSRFVVKDASSFGKPNLMASLQTPLAVGEEIVLSVGLANAKVGNQRSFFVDLGDGNIKEYKAMTGSIPAQPNVVAQRQGSGAISIYMPEGETLTALKIEDLPLTSLDLANAVQLAELTLTDTRLENLDLQWNRLLERIDITGNNFGAAFSLAGANGGYGKNILYHINLANNNMTSVQMNEPGSWQYVDLSHNHLTDLNFSNADFVRYLDVSHNDFEYLKINYLGQLQTFFCNDNRLSELILPENNVIETFNCANNRFTLANMPVRNGLDEEHFTYAPQAVIEIPTKGPGYNLSEQNVTIDGKSTVFTWKTTDGATLVSGQDYTCHDGITRFNDSTIGMTLYCEISNAAYPALSGADALTTTAMLSAGMPTHLLGEFTTTQGGQAVRVSLASAVPNNSLYIDWTGTESLEQYPMTTSYTVYSAQTTAGARVKVWSYDDDDALTVFSISNAKMQDVDLREMKHLVFLGLSDSGISSLQWPESAGLRELSLEGCKFTEFDFGRYPELNFVNFDYNRFTSVDLTGLDRLGTVGFANNSLQNITFGGNTALWQVALTGNQLSTVDLSGAPNLEQVYLDNNRLTEISLDGLDRLRVIYLDNNRFDFSTLPVPQPQWVLYTYGNQPELQVQCHDGSVDLSSQAERDGVKTVYTWFYDAPTFNPDDGTISGEELFEDDEYVIRNGVTTFLTDIDKACCVLTNELFPRTYLITNVLSVTGNGVASPSVALSAFAEGRTIVVSGAAEGAGVKLCAVSGQVLSTATASQGRAVLQAPGRGTYILVADGAVAKIQVK